MAKGAAQQGGGAQRSSCVCDLAMVLVILEIVVGVLLAIIGVVTVIAVRLDSIVSGIYILAAGVISVLVALMYLEVIRKYFFFLYTFFGRGAWFLFWGMLSLPGSIQVSVPLICGIIAVVIGVVYLICACFVRGSPKALCTGREATDGGARV